MVKIKTSPPEGSILNINHRKFDYFDSYQGTLCDADNNLTLVDAAKAFISSRPGWVRKLFILRNLTVSLFGLKTPRRTGNSQDQLENFKYEKGYKLGLFKVHERTEHEIILGEDDKHLNFRASLFIERRHDNPQLKNLIVSTAVDFNNLFGRLYFLAVMPFHKLIVQTTLGGAIKELEKRNGLSTNNVVVKIDNSQVHSSKVIGL
ncbi:DUF2867 domain-containing protein [Pontibacter toksunensis]|uniref:DUF2867 domain-containing protein n=1 Tax=Pontibacter toksunensis TaxID=1332631 RepID=A0ABW6BYA8_9BACT